MPKTSIVSTVVHYQPQLHVVLFQPEIPQNTGNIGRTCVAIGAKLWLVRPLGFQLNEASLRRAGLDYWEQLEWEAVADWTALRQRLTAPSFWYYSKSAMREYTDPEFQREEVLVFGSETRGLPSSMIAQAGARVLRIPMRPAVRSLNLACSVAVAVYEAQRQWNEAARTNLD